MMWIENVRVFSVCACVRVRACVRVCVRACARARVCVCSSSPVLHCVAQDVALVGAGSEEGAGGANL